MPYRIYTLANEWGIESEQLLTLCTKLGIIGKSGKLASLEDNEAALLAKSLGKKLGPPAIVLAGPTPRASTKVEMEIPSSLLQSLISNGKIGAANQLPDYINCLLHQEIYGKHSRLRRTADELIEEWLQKNVDLKESHSVADIDEYATRCERYLLKYGYAERNVKIQTSKVFIRMGLRRRNTR